MAGQSLNGCSLTHCPVVTSAAVITSNKGRISGAYSRLCLSVSPCIFRLLRHMMAIMVSDHIRRLSERYGRAIRGDRTDTLTAAEQLMLEIVRRVIDPHDRFGNGLTVTPAEVDAVTLLITDTIAYYGSAEAALSAVRRGTVMLGSIQSN